MTESFHLLQRTYREQVQPHEGNAPLGGLAEFLNAYQQQVENLKSLISACRTGD
jgi:hypothetical protein